jgi:hypothetical protein
LYARQEHTYYLSTFIHTSGEREHVGLNLAQRGMHCNRPRISLLDLLMTTGERETGAFRMPSSSYSSPLSVGKKILARWEAAGPCSEPSSARRLEVTAANWCSAPCGSVGRKRSAIFLRNLERHGFRVWFLQQASEQATESCASHHSPYVLCCSLGRRAGIRSDRIGT